MFSLGTIYCMDLSIFHSAGLLVVIFGILWLSSAIIKYIWEWSIVVSVSRDSNMQLQLPPGSMGFPIIGETFSFLWKVYGHLVISRLRSTNRNVRDYSQTIANFRSDELKFQWTAASSSEYPRLIQKLSFGTTKMAACANKLFECLFVTKIWIYLLG